MRKSIFTHNIPPLRSPATEHDEAIEAAITRSLPAIPGMHKDLSGVERQALFTQVAARQYDAFVAVYGDALARERRHEPREEVESLAFHPATVAAQV